MPDEGAEGDRTNSPVRKGWVRCPPPPKKEGCKSDYFFNGSGLLKESGLTALHLGGACFTQPLRTGLLVRSPAATSSGLQPSPSGQ